MSGPAPADLSQEGLAPCPFCGSEDIDPQGWASTESAGPACSECGASAGRPVTDNAANIAAWNRRAASPSGGAGAEAVPQLGGAPDDLRNLIQIVFADMTIERMNEVCKQVLACRDPALAAPIAKRDGEAVKVKPLVWRKAGLPPAWYADRYQIWKNDGAPDLYIVSGWARGTNLYESLEAAKAAAQADYEQRVLSALATPSRPDSALQASWGDSGPIPGQSFGDEFAPAEQPRPVVTEAMRKAVAEAVWMLRQKHANEFADALSAALQQAATPAEPSQDMVEATARAIYEQMDHSDGNGVKGPFGKGFYSDQARRFARAALSIQGGGK